MERTANAVQTTEMTSTLLLRVPRGLVRIRTSCAR